MSQPASVASHHNNFDLIRLVLALLVVMSHGNHTFEVGIDLALFAQAELAVNGFFIVSGFLISWSIDRQFDVRSYGIKRLARIYPLYAVVIAAQCVLLWYFNRGPLDIAEMLRYIGANLATLNFIQPTFGDMVDSHINGALWTIKVELMFYVAMPIYIWLWRKLGLSFVIVSWAASFAYLYTMDEVSIALARQLPGSMCFFIAGSMSYFYGEKVIAWLTKDYCRIVVVLVALAVIAESMGGDYGQRFIYVVALSAAIYFVAFYVPTLRLHHDMSYGVYLWHMPVFLTLRHVGFLADQPILAFAVGSGLVIVLALISAIWVEEPMIAWGKETARRQV